MHFAHVTISHTEREPARAFAKDYGAPAIRIQGGGAVVVIQRPGMTQAQADAAAAMLNAIFAGADAAHSASLSIAAE